MSGLSFYIFSKISLELSFYINLLLEFNDKNNNYNF